MALCNTVLFDVIITGNDIVALPIEMSRALIETKEYVIMDYIVICVVTLRFFL